MPGKLLVVFAIVVVSKAALIKHLSTTQLERLSNWKPDDKQNIWELSGQYQGDVILSSEERNGLIHEVTRWPDNEIPYEFDLSLSEELKDHISDSLKIFEEGSCVKARPKTKDDGNYVYITNEDTGCWSSVGRQGGKQLLNLQGNKIGGGCFRSATIVHEFLHALGFYHQQSASDRDDFVDILWDNIGQRHAHNFEKYPANVITNLGEKYDYGSVMHYGEYAFSANGEKTIVPKESNAKIGQRDGPSSIDIAKLNKMYACQ